MNKPYMIKINKNRGWRGLAEVVGKDVDGNTTTSMVFSFSQNVWDDLLEGRIVMQDADNYYVLEFDNIYGLPKKTQQRSVLIKNFSSTVTDMTTYPKNDWYSLSSKITNHQYAIKNFIANRNNHTQSDWNCIGIRVVPTIII